MRTKQEFFPESATVQLKLCGPPSVIDETKIVKARLSQTWSELLNRTGGLKRVSRTRRLIVCTLNYTPTNPKNCLGWCADMHDKIGEFVNKFERKRKTISVRLCLTGNSTRTGNRGIKNLSTRNGHLKRPKPARPTKAKGRKYFPSNAAASASSPGPSIVMPLQRSSRILNPKQQPYGFTNRKRRNYQTVVRTANRINDNAKNQAGTNNLVKNGVNGDVQPEKIQRTGDRRIEFIESSTTHQDLDQVNQDFHPLVKKEQHLVELDWSSDSESEEDDDDDLSSDDDSDLDANLEFDENDQLRREGIAVKQIKPLVEERANRFDNSLYLKVRDEIRKLKKTKQWDGNIKRAPLSCFLIQSIVGE